MAKIKHTKNELKAQRQALARYERYLPMLQLKKQQLQIEIQHIDVKIRQTTMERDQVRSALSPWIKLFSEPVEIDDLLSVREIRMGTDNIAGVDIPVLEEAVRGVEGVLDDPEPAVILLGLGLSSVDWSARVWARAEDFGAVKQASIRAVKTALDNAGIEIPFPQMDVHVTQSSDS